ncbi:hypothetical protein RZN22_02490 [Bacillaceae bacterium S4-13-58]
MKWKMVLLTGALVSAFGIGSILGPSDISADEVIKPQTPNEAVGAQTSQFVQQGMNGHYGPRMGQYFQGTMSTTAADLLGLTMEELRQHRLEGKSVQEIADEQGVQLEEVISLMTVTKEKQLSELVEQGVITQEQKEYMLTNMEEMMEANISRTDVGSRKGEGYRGNCSVANGDVQPSQGMRGFGGQGRAFQNVK